MPNGGKAISLGYARQLVKNYLDNKLGKPLLTDDTEAIWFSKEIILDALGLDPNLDTKAITGLRLYMGAYSDKDGYPANVADQNKLTLVVVPTNDQTIEVDRGSQKEEMYKDNVNDTSTQPAYPSAGATTSKVYNDGSMIPPPPKPAAALGLMEY